MQTVDPLIRTKLSLPFTRPALVPRPRLHKRFREGLRGPLTLIAAPAGFGKTTLVASAVLDCRYPVAWLALDEDDNREGRFLTYVIAALQTVDHRIGSEAAQFLAASSHVPPEVIMTSLANDLDAFGEEIVLALDDYHVISSPSVHAAMAFLLDHCPRTCHVVIATRSDPPLPLGRLRACAQMVELRAADLSFTEAEAAQFLNDIMGLHLDDAAVAVLETRTEGWIAGLQMAALSMRDRDDTPGFIEDFSGTNRHVLDYLLEEVLFSQSPDIQRFLLYTSILERLTTPLCDAVLAGDTVPGRGDTGRPAGSTLAYLDRANLFVVPLDDARNWYRYHHLFADLLRAHVQQTLTADEIVVLHTRAAQWYEQNGFSYEAIYHASLTADHEWVENLIERNYTEMMQRGESHLIRFWTGKLSKELVYRRPLLCIHEAMSLAWFGQLDEADEFLAQADKHLQNRAPTPDVRFMVGYAAYVKSRTTAMRGDIRQSIELNHIARASMPASNLARQNAVGVMLGYGYFLDGDFANAIQTLNDTIQTGVAVERINTTIGAYCVLARIYTLRGQLQRAYELYQEARAFLQQVEGLHLGANSVVDVGMADVMYEWNRLDAAHMHIQQGLECIPYWSKPDDIALAYTIHAHIQQAQGDIAAAVATINKGVQLFHSGGVFSEARDAVMTAEVRLALAQGNSPVVGRWSEAIPTRDLARFENELAYITLARVYMAHEQMDDALTLLARLEANARADGRMGRCLGIMLLKALAAQRQGDTAQALSLVAESLALAAPEGYARTFLDEGPPMQMLLAQWVAQAGAGPLWDYADHLLAQFAVEPRVAVVVPGKSIPHGALIEPLSQRELEVLHIMALGKTNDEIAAQLVIARGTVKAHTASIYRKLDVTNRTEAVARARQLGVLP